MELTHKQKVKMARRHITSKEILERIPIFQTEWWEKRKSAIQARVKRQELKKKLK